jgi:hypothetical protein
MPKLLATLELAAAYSSVAVFDPDLEKPYNNWTDRHIEQGFSWRDGSVSLSTVASTGVKVEVWLSEQQDLLSHTQRAIQVPFIIHKSGQVGISDISGEDHIVEVPEGSYNLIFENGLRSDVECSPRDDELGLRPMWCRLSFIISSSPHAEILKEEGRVEIPLSPTYPLLMEAEPA